VVELSSLKKIGEGKYAEVFHYGDSQFLKLFHGNAHSEDHYEEELKKTRLIGKTRLPVPKILGTTRIQNRPGIIFSKVKGGIALKSMIWSRPWRAVRFARMLAETHSQIHLNTIEELPSQRVLMTEQIESASELPQPLKDAALAALAKLPDNNLLCHGDLHLDNIIATPKGFIIIDWYRAVKGNPMADVATTSIFFQLGSQGMLAKARSVFKKIYLKHYARIHPGAKLASVSAWELPVAVSFAAVKSRWDNLNYQKLLTIAESKLD